MDRSNIDEVANAIVALKVWKKASRYNWAIVSELFSNPLIATVDSACEGPVAGRLLLFNGFASHRDFMIFRQDQDLSYAMSPADFDHYELIGLKTGKAELLDCRPGFKPAHPDAETRTDLLPALYECYGVMLRMEENPELASEYAGENALFSRREGLDGRWTDAPLKVPSESVVTLSDRIALDRALCAQGARLDMASGTAWEVDFLSLPMFTTGEPPGRTTFLLAAVDSKTGERKVWSKLAVDPASRRDGSLDALKPLWESIAGRLLEGIVAAEAVPEEIHVRSRRMLRFLRPLGMQIPFKTVLHGQLPHVAVAVNRAILEKAL